MSQKFYCKCCGIGFPSVFALVNARCVKQSGGRNHVLYEGCEKSKYTCKYCGLQFPTIFAMVNACCLKSPTKGGHEPAL
jgi:hypothetical protein